AIWHADHVWAASTVAVASLAAAVTALWQRREIWAFTAALGVNLTVSLLVWSGFHEVPPERWWVSLLQANTIATASVALASLAVRRWLSTNLLLSLQVILAVVGNAVLLLGPAGLLVAQPVPVHQHVIDAGQLWGWLAMLLASAATVWHAGQLLAYLRVHV